MRVFSGTIFGYLLFELLWMGAFRVTNTDPHAPASMWFQLGAIVFGVLMAVVAGQLATVIGGRPHFNAAWIAAGLVVLTAVYVMVKDGPSWVQVTAALIMAPFIVVGGWTYVINRRAKANDGDE